MFNKIYELEQQIKEYELYLKCGIYRIAINNQIILVENKINTLKNSLEYEINKAKEIYYK